MQIFIGDELIGNVNIDFASIDKCRIINEDTAIMVPCHEPVLLRRIKKLIDDVVDITRPIWKFPDYNNFESYIYISDGEYRIALEVFPKRISEETRSAMLVNACKEVRLDGYSDYYEMLDAFSAIDDFYNSNDKCGEIWSYHVQPTDEEIKLLVQLSKT